ncbi:hypothetical protein RWE15_14925 [Virgibacillus halophilus]|uniref:DUF4878 domain-containing protein n=1 Tax=Tigheibacillus halophilus TaxID=361280 RepID=A0ABU5C836_9BACI|nr:hypothetical protein [Virgibacillus halophilus]
MWGKKLMALCVMLLLSLAIAACSDNASKDKKDEDKTKTEEKGSKVAAAEKTETDKEKENAVASDEVLFAVLDANLQAYKDKDLDAYMDTIHSGSPVFDTTRQQMEAIIDKDLDMEITDMKVEEKNEDKAKVSYVQRTVAKEPIPEFKNNEVKGYHELRQEDGQWKIYASQANDVTYLDEDGNPIDEDTIAETQASADNGEMDGQYADQLKQMQQTIAMKLTVAEYTEDDGFASALFTIADGKYKDNQVTLEYVAGAKGELSPKEWMELVREQYTAQVGDKFDLQVYDTTKNETMFELVIKADDDQIDQAQIGRVFFKRE